MAERTILVFSRNAVVVTHEDGSPTAVDVIAAALNGDAFSWETPDNLALTFPTDTVAITFDDADGFLKDDPYNGATVSDQRLTEPLTINGVTYTPNTTALRWQSPPPVMVEDEYEVTLFDSLGTAYRMVGVSITEGYSTTVVGVAFEGTAPPPGTTLYYIQGASSYSGTKQSVAISDVVTCFLAGTEIETETGPRPIEDLVPGDLVMTVDGGLQPVRWIGRSTVCGLGPLAPIRIRAGVLGNTRDLWVSPNHRILLRSSVAELYFGTSEVLVAAKFLVDGAGVSVQPVPRADYLHLLLDSHALVFSEGIATESLFSGAAERGVLDPAAQEELQAIFPDLMVPGRRLCRSSLRRGEAALLRHRPVAAVQVAPARHPGQRVAHDRSATFRKRA
jgi:hypothetical protein